MITQTENEGHSTRGIIGRSEFHSALIGHGIQFSRTPKMHTDEGAALGIGYRYDLIDTQMLDHGTEIEALLDRAEAAGCIGVNITHPFKKSAIPFIDHLSDAARAVHAVNTVLFKDGQRYGHNTDYWGFAEAFKRHMAGVACNRILLVGAGGAGAAVANALVDHKTDHLMIFDKNRRSSQELADELSSRSSSNKISVVTDLELELSKADGLINATPVGMATHPGMPVPAHILRPDQWVADIIYFPLETELLVKARAHGCKVMDGSGMAVFQAVRAFEIFTGLVPDPTRMRATFDAFTH